MQNIYQFIQENSQHHPDKLALSIKSLQHSNKVDVTYKKFQDDVDDYAQYLSATVSESQRVLLVLPVCYELYVCLFALFKLGACVVLLNPNMNRLSLKHSLKLVNADVMIANKQIWKFRWMFWDILRIKTKLSLDSNGWGIVSLFNKKQAATLVLPKEQAAALISFTSGSSGQPKAVVRTYENLIAQHLALKKLPKLDQHYDMTAFPVVVLHHLCNGISCAIADINYKDISAIKNQAVIKQILNEKINSLSGAITYLLALGEYLQQNNIPTQHIKVIATGGSPIQNWQCDLIKQYFPKARLFILYGSSEVEPIAHIEVSKKLDQSFGFVVGSKSDDVKLAFEALSSKIKPFAYISNFSNTAGEIYVSGSHVCNQYYKNKKANQSNKYIDKNNITWHRTGDVGFMNEQGRLVLTGRIENCLNVNNTLIGSYPVELFINALLNIKLSAVVENKLNEVVLYISQPVKISDNDIVEQVYKQFKIKITKIEIIESIPVDTRHQGKIQYGQLKQK
ncbi:MAG: AMP-binding protein [Saccharospirillaceae bacterium]|nr:AMP-binding protein [Pseudomonadales bacterium]NRB77512.1 AMP-binding protein [Saccharospirillaceae bacterium]